MSTSRPRTDFDSLFPGRVLFGRVRNAIRAAHDEALAPFGVTTSQGEALVSCMLGEANTPAELARFTDLDISSISRMLDRLENKGLVTRSRTGKDRRQVIVKITARGRALVKKAVPVAARVAADAWRNVSEQERQTVRNIVSKILGNLGHLQKS